MDRVQFTRALADLLALMHDEGERVLIDYVKRSTSEQKRLHGLGLSRCDGTLKRSAHQSGRAADLYFVTSDGSKELGTPVKGFDYWHDVWVKLGGKPAISWDMGHFEG